MASQVRFITIDQNSDSQRLDNFLIKFLKGAPKSLIYRIIRKGEVRVNKGRSKPERKLKEGDVVRVPPVNIGERAPIAKLSDDLVCLLKNAILYEDEKLMVVNKPSGLAVHGGSGIQVGLIEALRQIGGEGCYRELVHRIDRGTSGCVMVAKKRPMLRYLQGLLRDDHQIQKKYRAICIGEWPNRRKVITAPLMKIEQPSGEHIVKVHPEGKASETRFTIIEKHPTASLIEATLITGRTHQIRVHTQYAKHPLVGDDKYGDDQTNKALTSFGAKRLFLHAYSLRFTLQSGDTFYIEAPTPIEFSQFLKQI